MKIYLVGGAVRDEVMGVESRDKDYVVVGSNRQEMLSFGFISVGNDFPIFLHPETKEEYALARNKKEESTSIVSLSDDLKRRDLTINSIAKDAEGNYIDPLNGIDDIKNKVIRHTGSSFKDDPLRILRAARFGANNPDFKVADDTKKEIYNLAKSGAFAQVDNERIWQEMEKMLVSAAPYRFFEILDETGALEFTFPEIHKMKGVVQRPDYHAEGDVFIHNQMVLKEATYLTENYSNKDKSLVRFACLCHDLGKTKTPNEMLYYEDGNVKGSHYSHDSKEVVDELISDFAERINAPRKFKTFAYDVAWTHQKMHQIEHVSAKKITRMLSDLSPDRKASNNDGEHYLDLLLTSCEADARGRLSKKNGIVVEPDEKIKNSYPARDVIKRAYSGFKNIGEPLQDWIKSYSERNEQKPTPELIKSKVHEIKVSNVKKSLT